MFSPTLLLSDCVSLFFILHMTGLAAFLLKSVELSLETVNCHWCRLGCYKSRPHKSPYVCCRLAYTTTLLLFIIASFFHLSCNSRLSAHTFLSLRCKSVLQHTMLCLFSDFIHSISTEHVQWRFDAVSRLSHVHHKLKPSIVNKKKQQAKEEEKLPRRWQRWRRLDTGKPELTHQRSGDHVAGAHARARRRLISSETRKKPKHYDSEWLTCPNGDRQKIA